MARSRLAPLLLAAAFSTIAAIATADARAEPQSVRGRSLIFGSLLGVRSFRDDTLVPLASTGPVLMLSGRFLGTAGIGVVDTELRLGSGIVLDRETRPGIAITYGMRLAYLPVLNASPDSWSIALGPVVAWENDIFWLAKWDDAHGYWLGRRWLGPSIRAWRLLTPRRRLDIAAETSLFGFESRPPAYRHNKQDALRDFDFYIAGVNRDAAFGWFTDFQALRIAVDVHDLDGKTTVPTGWGLGVEARFAHAQNPNDAFIIETSIRLERAWGVP